MDSIADWKRHMDLAQLLEEDVAQLGDPLTMSEVPTTATPHPTRIRRQREISRMNGAGRFPISQKDRLGIWPELKAYVRQSKI
jgi:hypothetical protein